MTIRFLSGRIKEDVYINELNPKSMPRGKSAIFIYLLLNQRRRSISLSVLKARTRNEAIGAIEKEFGIKRLYAHKIAREIEHLFRNNVESRWKLLEEIENFRRQH